MKPWMFVVGAGLLFVAWLTRSDADYVEMTDARRADFAARSQRAQLERIW